MIIWVTAHLFRASADRDMHQAPGRKESRRDKSAVKVGFYECPKWHPITYIRGIKLIPWGQLFAGFWFAFQLRPTVDNQVR